MSNENKLIAHLCARRRSVEAEIKRIEQEAPVDSLRAASNGGYLAALYVEQAFLAGILAQSQQ